MSKGIKKGNAKSIQQAGTRRIRRIRKSSSPRRNDGDINSLRVFPILARMDKSDHFVNPVLIVVSHRLHCTTLGPNRKGPRYRVFPQFGQEHFNLFILVASITKQGTNLNAILNRIGNFAMLFFSTRVTSATTMIQFTSMFTYSPNQENRT